MHKSKGMYIKKIEIKYEPIYAMTLSPSMLSSSDSEDELWNWSNWLLFNNGSSFEIWIEAAMLLPWLGSVWKNFA